MFAVIDRILFYSMLKAPVAVSGRGFRFSRLLHRSVAFAWQSVSLVPIDLLLINLLRTDLLRIDLLLIDLAIADAGLCLARVR
jgi:hypothetical protein